MNGIRERLRVLRIQSGRSLPEVTTSAGIDVDPTVLGKKLNGGRGSSLRVEEAEAVATTLGYRLTLVKARPRARRKAAA